MAQTAIASESKPATESKPTIDTSKIDWKSIEDQNETLKAVMPGKLPSDIPEFWKKNIKPEYFTKAMVEVLRNARNKAISNLVTRLKREKIYSDVTISRFLEESDDKEFKLELFLQGANERGVRLREDILVCEVKSSTILRASVAQFKGWADKHIKSKNVDLRMLSKYVKDVQHDNVNQLGIAAVNSKYVQDKYREKQKDIERAISSIPPIPLWISESLEIVAKAEIIMDNNSNGKSPSLLAYEAAVKDGKEKLAAMIQKLEYGKSTLVEFSKEFPSDKQIMVNEYQNSAFISIHDEIQENMQVVTLRCSLKPIWNILLQHRIAKALARK